ncbi:MAG: DNA polymerase III subunit delta [Chloroflexi bacterium]|nr:DNA polymerase III subunit delta [Chloroflexota bacterium]
MYYILHGEDEFSRTEELNKLRAKMGDPQFADLNTMLFDGRKVSFGELQHACDSVPFLADKRLVIVEGMLTRLEPRRTQNAEDGDEIEEEVNPDLAKDLKEYLPRLPDSTRLVFVESKTLAKNNPILKQAEGDKKNAHVKEFQLPKETALPRWIQARVAEKQGAIEPDAVNALAAHVGSDLRLMDNEIAKLLAYCGPEPIRVEDVNTLVAAVRESSIFDLVDAIGARQTSAALKLLHAQLDQNAAPLYLLTMIARQFRMLLQIKDLAARGMNPAAIREQLKLHPFVVDKTYKQAANFSVPQLERAYGKLLETDLAMKTSRSDPVAALDLLIVDLTQK